MSQPHDPLNSFRITLYYFKEPNIEVNTTAAFDGDKLILSEFVANVYLHHQYGLHDFTYITTLNYESAMKLGALLGAAPNNKLDLLQKLAAKFNQRDSHNAIMKFLSDNSIEFNKGEGPISWF